MEEEYKGEGGEDAGGKGVAGARRPSVTEVPILMIIMTLQQLMMALQETQRQTVILTVSRRPCTRRSSRRSQRPLVSALTVFVLFLGVLWFCMVFADVPRLV